MPKILIAEDEPTVLMLAQSILEDADHEVLIAGDGTQAIALLKSGASPNLIITDINMGSGPDGFAVADFAHGGEQKPKVIYASALPDTDGLRARFVEGAGFLPKPYDGAALLQAVTEALG